MNHSMPENVVFQIYTAKKHFGPTKALGIECPEDTPLKIYRGATTAILGLSGSGKSTLLNLLALLEDPDTGSRFFYNSVDNGSEPLDCAKLSNREKTELQNREFGVAFQDGHLIGHIGVTDNIALPMSSAGAAQHTADQVSDSLISNLNLKHRQSARPKELSGGEYQRVAIARAMSHNPKVIFVDEPTGNLDTDTSRIVMDMLHTWREKSEANTLILVTHDIQQAYNYADQFIILKDGGVEHRFSKAELDSPEWREARKLDSTAESRSVLLQLLDTSIEKADDVAINFQVWNHKTHFWRRIGYVFWYGLRDLFPIKIRPFNPSVFLTTLRDTIFSALTILSITMLVAVLLLGYGIFHGVNRYQHEVQKHDIRANRLIVEIEASSTVSEIDEELLTRLETDLKQIKVKSGRIGRILSVLPGVQNKGSSHLAVEGIYGFSSTQLFVYRFDRDSDSIGALGSTVQPNSPLLSRLTYKRKKLQHNPIADYNTEGVIVKESWLKARLKWDKESPPENLIIQYGRETGGTSREELPLLAVVDDLPDGVFLISPGCWHQIRDRRWKSNYRAANLTVPQEVEAESLAQQIQDAIQPFEKSATVRLQKSTDGRQLISIASGRDGGWRKLYWENLIYKRRVKPLLEEAEIAAQVRFELTLETAGDEAILSRLTYVNAAVYLIDIGVVGEVARTIRESEARLGVDAYVENVYKRIHQTTQLSALILGVIAVCAFFLSTTNIFLMFYQTVLRKRHEIGILKAFGSSKSRIASIFFVESFYVSFLGCVFGLFLVMYAGNWVGETLAKIYELSTQADRLFYLDWRIVGVILVTVLLCCAMITYFATSRTASKTANELLRQRD
jgi:putative ABC transport system ATP-binding protein